MITCHCNLNKNLLEYFIQTELSKLQQDDVIYKEPIRPIRMNETIKDCAKEPFKIVIKDTQEPEVKKNEKDLA